MKNDYIELEQNLKKLRLTTALTLMFSAQWAFAEPPQVKSCFNNLQEFMRAETHPGGMRWLFDPERLADGWCTIYEPHIDATGGQIELERLDWTGYGLDRSYKSAPAPDGHEVRVQGQLTAADVARVENPMLRALLEQALR